MSGILGDIEGAVGGIASLFGGGSASGAGGLGGDFLTELLGAFGGGSSSDSSGSGSGSTLGDIAKIAGDVAPLLALL